MYEIDFPLSPVRYRLVSQRFELSGKGNIFYVWVKENGSVIEVPDSTLFYDDTWFAHFTLNDMRKIALSVAESSFTCDRLRVEKERPIGPIKA